jgi:hypothetical protein
MNDASTARRKQFEAAVRKRVVEHDLRSNGWCCSPGPCHRRNALTLYQALRQIDSVLNGKVENLHRLSTEEYERLHELLDRVLPPKEGKENQ